MPFSIKRKYVCTSIKR